jgi:predicted Fe-Mo cluster-binding NifX family protein
MYFEIHSIEMKIAIPHWQGRISPVFDVARNVLLIETDGHAEASRQDVVFDPAGLFPLRVRQLARTGAEVLICGAISRPLESAIRAEGIDVIPHICGEISSVLNAFLQGQLNQSQNTFLMPGCRGRGMGRRLRHRGGRCRRGNRGGNYA